MKIHCIYAGCEKMFPCKAKMLDHFNIHINERPFKCPTCSKSYPSKKGLNAHEKTHTTSKYQCDVCNYKFVLKSNFKRHLIACNKRFMCEICNKIYKKKGCYEYHMKTKHPTIKAPILKCKICGTFLKSKISLGMHMKKKHKKPIDSDEYEYYCC